MKLFLLMVLAGHAFGRLLQGHLHRDSAGPVPSPARSGARSSQVVDYDDFASEMMDQMKFKDENMFEEVCKPLCKVEGKDGGTDSIEFVIDKHMWEGGFDPGWQFDGNFRATAEKKLHEKGYKLQQIAPLNASFTDSNGTTSQVQSNMIGSRVIYPNDWLEKPPENLPGKLRMVFQVTVYVKNCGSYGCHNGCMEYGHFIEFCRAMNNVRVPWGLPPDLAFTLNTQRKCVKGKQAESGCSPDDPSFQKAMACQDMECQEYCTVFSARSTEQLCVCDAAYLAVPKSKDEQDKDCLKPETFYKLASGHDVFGIAAEYVSGNMRKEETATFDVLDKDHDGFITRVEAGLSSPLHECADLDRDGKVSQKEYRAKTVRGIASCEKVQNEFASRCKSFDENKDGQISYTEWRNHHPDVTHVYTINTVADWDSRKLQTWFTHEVHPYGSSGGRWGFNPRRAIMVDANKHVLQLEGAMRGGSSSSPNLYGNASKESFERMQFPLQYRYTEPYGMFNEVPDPSGMDDFRSPTCVDLNSNGVVEMSECRAMGTGKRQIAEECRRCTEWFDTGRAQEDTVLTAAEASQCVLTDAEIALDVEHQKSMGMQPEHDPNEHRCGRHGRVMSYDRFHCLDTDHDLRVTAEECKAVGEQYEHMPGNLSPLHYHDHSAELREWSEEYFKWKRSGPAPAPVPAPVPGFLQFHQAPPSPSLAASPAPAQGRQMTYPECMSNIRVPGSWPDVGHIQVGSGSPIPAPSSAYFDIMNMDKNLDGKVSRQEAYDYAIQIPGGDISSTKVDRLFADADLDFDNFISPEEYATAGMNHNGDGHHQ